MRSGLLFGKDPVQYLVIISWAQGGQFSGNLGKNAEGKAKVAEVALMDAVQLEMKSKLKHGESHPVPAGAGNMECPIHSTTEVQDKYSKASDVDQVNPGDTLRLGSGRTRPSLW